MDKMALADRFEGYSKIFASDSNMGIDLKAMADTLREMPEEKFSKVIATGLDIGIGKAAPMMHTRIPLSEREHMTPDKGPKPKLQAKMISERGIEDVAKKYNIPADKMKSVYKDLLEASAASEEVEASEEVKAPEKTKEANLEAWTKSAADYVAQNLVRDIIGMEKSICCDTNRHLTKEQMPDAKKKQETKGAVARAEDTGAALKPEQVPDLSVKLDSDMYKKSKGPVKKEAAAEETPAATAEEKQDMKDAVKVEDPAEIAKKVKKMEDEKKKKELEEKSRPKKDESEVEANTIIAEGIEFDNVMQEVDANDEDVKKLSALFE